MKKKVVKKFEELTKVEKRIEICKDIIAQIELKNYTAKQGTYANITGLSKLHKNSSLQDALVENKVKCKVCALGSLFCSLIKYENKLTVKEFKTVHFFQSDEFQDEDTVQKSGRNRLEQYFTKKQLGLIESAFEQTNSYAKEGGYDTYSGIADKAAEYAERKNLEKPDEILKSICSNIVRNHGIFRP